MTSRHLPDEDTIARALHKLAETDEPYARAKASAAALEHRMKVARAVSYLRASGTVGERDSLAITSDEYLAKLSEYEDAVLERETLGAVRKRAELNIEVWRSLNANRRQGT